MHRKVLQNYIRSPWSEKIKQGNIPYRHIPSHGLCWSLSLQSKTAAAMSQCWGFPVIHESNKEFQSKLFKIYWQQTTTIMYCMLIRVIRQKIFCTICRTKAGVVRTTATTWGPRKKATTQKGFGPLTYTEQPCFFTPLWPRNNHYLANTRCTNAWRKKHQKCNNCYQ
jgi:hypothetical protein